MTDPLRKAAEMALKALVSSTGELRIHLASPTDAQLEKNYAAIEILRQALAQPEQKPVAWIHTRCGHPLYLSFQYHAEDVPLYTAPPKREWVGLTDDDLRQIILAAVGVAEAKLKEKNGG